MKKLLAILGSVFLVVSGVAASTSTITVSKNNLSQISNLETEKIDWNEVQNTVKDYFDNYKEQIEIANFSDPIYEQTEIDQTMEMAMEKANDYLTFFEANNFGYEEIIDILSNDSPHFKEAYQEELIKTANLINDQVDDLDINSFAAIDSFAARMISYSEVVAKYNPTLKALHTTKKVLLGISIAAGIAATAFYWTAAWTLGATIPYAIAATLVTATLGVFIGGVSAAIDYINGQITYIKGIGKAVYNTIKIAFKIKGIIKPLIVITEPLLLSAVWAFKGALAAAGAIASFVALLNELRDF